MAYSSSSLMNFKCTNLSLSKDIINITLSIIGFNLHCSSQEKMVTLCLKHNLHLKNVSDTNKQQKKIHVNKCHKYHHVKCH